MEISQMIWEQATTINQIRFYQLRMMETPIDSQERDIYKETIRNLQETQRTLFSALDGNE